MTTARGEPPFIVPAPFRADGRADWDARFMGLAIQISLWSKDRSRQVGCVIASPDFEIRSTGYNGFPRGFEDGLEERHARPAKYAWTEHAERNAIYNAARSGIPLKGCTIYLPWFPCIDCARAIVQAGMTGLVGRAFDPHDPTWGNDFPVAEAILKEGKVDVRLMELVRQGS